MEREPILHQSLVSAEKTVLSLIISKPELLNNCIDRGINDQSFIVPMHKTLWHTISKLSKSGQPWGIENITKQLESDMALDECGGISGLSEVLSFGYQFQFDSSVDTLLNEQKKRKIDATISKASLMCHDPSEAPQDVMAFLEKSVTELARSNDSEDIQSANTWHSRIIDNVEWSFKNRGKIRGMSCGFDGLDRILDGLQPGSMIVVAARPGMGKTSFLLNILMHLTTKESIPCGLFSLEMTGEQIMSRALYSVSRVNSQDIRSKEGMTKETMIRIRRGFEELKKADILYIDERSGLTIAQIQAKARRMVREKGVKCIGVDYLQLVHPNSRMNSREREIAEVSAGLKGIAKELEIPVIVLAQLNRDVEKRSDKAPMVSDLRDSGAIEQDADQILLISRNAASDDSGDSSQPVIANINVGKNRFGETLVAMLEWDAKTTTFRSLSSPYHTTPKK